MTKESPSQTAGPYVHIGLVPNFAGISGVYSQDAGAAMIDETTPGERITVTGVVIDGNGDALRDVLVEIWQADANGRYVRPGANAAFTGWGRCAGNLETGEFRFETIRPGPVPYPDGRMQAPHITFWIVARGINIGLQTRMYFPDADNADDPVLALAGERAGTLLARKTGEGAYRFDIRVQGGDETVFFDV